MPYMLKGKNSYNIINKRSREFDSRNICRIKLKKKKHLIAPISTK